MTRGFRARPTTRAVACAALGALVAGCKTGAPNDTPHAAYAVYRVVLDSLFNGIEHHRRLVLWSTDAADGPVLERMLPNHTPPAAANRIDVDSLAPSLPTRVMSEPQLTELFRRSPDAWAAFFRENPGAAGLIELSPVRFSAGGDSAEMLVGRTCGEHCRNAWRATVLRVNGAWRVAAIEWLRLSREQ